VTDALERTFRVLTRTPNESAAPILIRALDAPRRPVQEFALRALLERRTVAGHRELIRRWDSFGEHFRRIVSERPGRLTSALRDAVAEDDATMIAGACALAVATREFDLMPVLVSAAETRDNVHRELLLRTAVELAELLYEELGAPRDYRDRRDPQLTRRHLVGMLEQAIGRASADRRRTLVEGFLILVSMDNGLLRRVLDDARHPAHPEMIELFRTSPRSAIIQNLLRFLDVSMPPAHALRIIAERRDVPFLRKLCKHVGPEWGETVRRNLRHIEGFPWIEAPSLLAALSDAEQFAAVRITMASRIPRDEVLPMIRFLFREGRPGGRRAAAESLPEFGGSEANELALAVLDDDDATVQATVVRQIRDRGIPGAMAKLIQLIDSPKPEVQRAARESLREFTFQRYLLAFDSLEDDVRRTTGVLVRKIDAKTLTLVAEELASPSRIRRMRGLRIVAAMGVVGELESSIIDLLGDEDHFLRAEAARTLGGCRSGRARHALREALQDRSAAVQEAAEEALQMPAESASVQIASALPADVASYAPSATATPDAGVV